MTPFTDGLGGGVETRRSYLAEDFPSGSQRSVTQWMKTLVGRDDVLRVWLKPTGTKIVVWEHSGPLVRVPDLDPLFAGPSTGEAVEIELAAA